MTEPTPLALSPLSIIDQLQTYLGDDASDDEAREFINRWENLKRAFRQVDEHYKQQVRERIEHRGPITVGEVRYYVGPDRDTICNDVPGTLDAVMVEVKGDMLAASTYMVSQPFKPGACKKLLPPDRYAELFSTVVKSKVKEGKPERKLLTANTRFTKGMIE